MLTRPDSLYVTLLILLYSLTSESVKFEVFGPTDPIVAVAGDDIILPCYLKPNISVEDMTVDWLNLDSTLLYATLVYRYRNGKNILEDQIPSYRARTSLFKEELWRGNTSLKLTRVQGTDEGHYKCFIKAKDWYDDTTIQVLVKAVGSRPVVSIEGHREGGMGLVCQSEGWHPEPDLVWLDSKGVSLSAGPPETHRDFKGFYTVKKHVIVKETDINRFTCRVLQKQINEEVETEVHIPRELFYYTPWRWPFIVLCFLGVIAVTGLALTVCYIHKKKGELQNQLDHIKKEGVFRTRRIVLVGKTGAGKSSSGNTILGRKAFEVAKSCTPVTQKCCKETGEVAGTQVVIVDTPGLFDSHDRELETEIGQCINLTSSSPHAIVLVMDVGPFTLEEENTVKKIRELFGDEAEKYTMILFTHRDQLDPGGIERYVNRGSERLKRFISQFGDKYHVFDNTKMDDRDQVLKFMEKIDNMLNEWPMLLHKNEMYTEVEKRIC